MQSISSTTQFFHFISFSTRKPVCGPNANSVSHLALHHGLWRKCPAHNRFYSIGLFSFGLLQSTPFLPYSPQVLSTINDSFTTSAMSHEKNLKCFSFVPRSVSKFFITFKDQDDLYRAFKEKLKELGIPPETVYNLDYDYVHEEINNAENLDYVVGNNKEVALCVRDRNEYVNSFADSADDSARHSWHKGRMNEPSHRRDRSNKSDRCRRRHCSTAGHIPCSPSNWGIRNMDCFCFCHERPSGYYNGPMFYPCSYYGPPSSPFHFHVGPHF